MQQGNSRAPRVIAALCLWAGSMAVANAQDGASLVGRVLTSEGSTGFEGAQVAIPELGRTTTTARDGRYRFNDLPAGAHTVVVRYLGAPEDAERVELDAGERMTVDFRLIGEGTQLEDVLVVGQAAGQAAAINQQRASDNLKSVVSADAIGQFPDQNAAEALRRLPGVSVANDQGEGRFVIVRGIDPALSATTINGIRVPGPEDDTRQVNLDVISSDLLESIEVIKTVTPDMDGDTVGGTVALKSVTAFDRGDSLTLRGYGSFAEINSETSPRLSAAATRLFSVGDGEDNLGVAGSISWFRRDFGSDNVETSGWPELETPDGDEIRGLEEAEQRDYTIVRERLSASLNFDYRPSADSSYFLRTLFSDFSDDELQVSNVFAFEEGDITAIDARSARFEGAEVERLSEARKETQEIFSLAVGGEHFFGAAWTLDYQAGHAFANEDNPSALGATFVGEDLDVGYDLAPYGSEKPALFGTSAAFNNAGNYALDELVLEDSFTEERENSFEINLRRDTNFGPWAGFLKTGAKARLREKEGRIDAFVYEGFGGDFTVADFVGAPLDYPFGAINPYAGRGEVRDFFFANRDSFELNAEDSELDSRIDDYDVEENIYAGYVMASVDIGAARIFGGVRVERTEYEAEGTTVRVTDDGVGFDPFVGDKSYTDVLPSLHLRYALGERAVLRASYAETLARPDFEAAAPRAELEIEEDDGEISREGEAGNPDLDPLRAQNLDLSVEFYPGGVSVIGAGVFYKRLDDFFVRSDIAGSGNYAEFDEVIATVNGDSADLYGVELNFVRQFSNLPSPFDGTLISANYTYTDSEATLPFRDGDVPLPRQSENLFNLALGYDKYGISMRLAASFRDAYLDEINELDDPAFDRYADDHLQLDFTGKFRMAPQLQFFFNVINITDEPFFAYFDEPRYASQYEEYGRTVEFGLGYDF